ncbi:MAG TPA: lysylphosphatidylglycerol synthase transmembrane domain-containing protein [Tepidisphaeraceae bacterium]|nr:lysylphosphatidylglycerol synthase transmembrane domain-containing protein [Tepidisphaeraceae bacterium]
MPQSPSKPRPEHTPRHRPTFAERIKEFFAGYFWFILKNVIGWLMMLSALPLGIVLPGPGGLPIFIIGFALVTFPGKRKLTARVMRGRRMQLESAFFTTITSFVSILLTGGIISYLLWKWGWAIESYSIPAVTIVLACILAAALTWVVTRLALRVGDWILRNMPRARRFIRPWLRKKGFYLLPPRRKAGLTTNDAALASNEEILEIHPRHQTRLIATWNFLRPWLTRALSLTITILILLWILKPIQDQWHQIREEILRTSPGRIARFLIASAMFAAFLFLWRALVWRRILIGFGYRLPVRVATRIWSISELARYLPGAIWQVVGRVYMVRPYGVSGAVSSTSQILEVFTFLLANVLMASLCLLYFAVHRGVDGQARFWLITAMALVPALAFVLHPKVFYRLVNRVLVSINKPPITQRLGGEKLLGVLAWVLVGLVWQGLAVWLITYDLPVGLPLAKWWIVAGAYSLAWVAGFLAIWAPSGIGVREVVFMAVMAVVLPSPIKQAYADSPAELTAFLAFLSLLLRLWAIAGELILAIVSLTLDLPGAMGDAEAVGRMPQRTPAPPPTQLQETAR